MNDFRPIDGVLITHEHYDHVGGLDDLRPFAVSGMYLSMRKDILPSVYKDVCLIVL